MEEKIEKIKSTGYWRVEIHPTVFIEDRIKDLSTAQKIIEGSVVSLRGWDYPHIAKEGILNGIDWIESVCDWRRYVEYWRFYQSGMFIHYFACKEDYLREEAKKAAEMSTIFWAGSEKIEKAKAYLSVFNTLFRITEIFEFAMRLVQKQVLEPAVVFSIELFRTKGRMLFIWDHGRELHDAYISIVESIPINITIPSDELLAKGHEIALEKTIHLFERFNWKGVSVNVLKEEQKKFLERRL